MNPADWIDTGASPPLQLPGSIEAALTYIAHAVGHPLYTRWTLSVLKRGCPSLADAKREHPAVFALLLEHEAAVEYWERGRLKIVAADDAPSPDSVLERVLHQHRRRFHRVTDESALIPGTGAAGPATAAWLAVLEPSLTGATPSWLARAGRFVNPSRVTNTLGVADDAQAVILFLRDRASRSPHTLRAYLGDLQRLIAWCGHAQLGPLSDLTRHDLLAYRRALEHGPVAGANPSPGARHRARHGHPDVPDVLGARSAAVTSRALAVVSSLFRYWLKTGYLVANPAAELSGGAAARAAWRPTRIMPAGVIALCDAVVTGPAPVALPAPVWTRRCAIWSLVPVRRRPARRTGVGRLPRASAARGRPGGSLDFARARQGRQTALGAAAWCLRAATACLPAGPRITL